MHVTKLNVGEKSKHLNKFDQCGSNDEKKNTFHVGDIFQVTDTKTRV